MNLGVMYKYYKLHPEQVPKSEKAISFRQWLFGYLANMLT